MHKGMNEWKQELTDGIVENEKVLVLVLVEGEDQGVQDEAKVRNQLLQ